MIESLSASGEMMREFGIPHRIKCKSLGTPHILITRHQRVKEIYRFLCLKV
jgi:hypothetical protein